jgi:hypothetical protein
MSIYEAIGMAWVIFSSALATVAIFYLAFIGVKVMINNSRVGQSGMPIEVKELFKITR